MAHGPSYLWQQKLSDKVMLLLPSLSYTIVIINITSLIIIVIIIIIFRVIMSYMGFP